MASQQFISRERLGKSSFKYTFSGGSITDKPQLDYCKSLRIPPAWKDVKIAKSKKSHVLATGYDNAGRLQYIYHPDFRAQKEQEKFERTLRFARALPRMRRITTKHLDRKKLDYEKVMACIVRLLDDAYFRVGNDTYARENDSYGLTTLRSKHMSVNGETITFDFIGKSKQKHVKHITDRQLSRIIKKLDELPGYEIFKYYDKSGGLKDVKSHDVNNYIKQIMGEEFSAKDFRTWGGTLLASAELARTERLESARERKKVVTSCVKKVARKLGNTPAIARSSYIDPRIINAYVESDDIYRVRQTISKLKKTRYLNEEEQCVLHLLEATR